MVYSSSQKCLTGARGASLGSIALVHRTATTSPSKAGFSCVKSGCVTCRIRKVKCDEGRPHCQRCLTTGRRCDGYTILPFSRAELLAAAKLPSNQKHVAPTDTMIDLLQSKDVMHVLLSNAVFASATEERCLEVFRRGTVTNSNQWLDCRFWDYFVLPACRTNSAVKHVAVALGALYAAVGAGQCDSTSSSEAVFAEHQYQQGLREAIRMISNKSEDVEVNILVLTVLFAAFEYSRHHLEACAIHLFNGQVLAERYLSRARLIDSVESIGEIQDCLYRLEAAKLAYACSRAHSSKLRNRASLGGYASFATYEFQSLAKARTALVALTSWFTETQLSLREFESGWDAGRVCELLLDQGRCASRLRAWKQAFQTLLDSSSRLPHLAQTKLLYVWWHAAIAASEARSVGPETRYDAMEPNFDLICEYAAQLSTSQQTNSHALLRLEGGCIPSLWFTAHKCRNPVIRRRAIDLLKGLRVHEGPWRSVEVVAVAVRAMEIEEDSLESVKYASDIPEAHRLSRIEIVSEPSDCWLEITILPSLVMSPHREAWHERLRCYESNLSDQN